MSQVRWSIALAGLWMLQASVAHAAPLSLAQLDALQGYLGCHELCDDGPAATKDSCLQGCAAVDNAWDKDKSGTVTQVDYAIAELEYWDGTQVCQLNGATVPIGACGLAACTASGHNAADCADADADGLRAWAETQYGTSDSTAQVACTSGSQCASFSEECKWLPEANRTLCVPRKCTGACTAFHLETVSQDNDEVIVIVHFDYAPEPPTVLDLYLTFDHAALTLVNARPLAELVERQKDIQVRYNSDGDLRLTVLGAATSLPIRPGPIVELMFQRSSPQQSNIGFSTNDYAQEWSMAPESSARRGELANDALWGSSVRVAAADPAGDQLLLHYSFDNPDSALDVARVLSGKDLCGKLASCANLNRKVPQEAELADKLEARLSNVQRGVSQISEHVSGVSGDAAFLDGKTDHLELPITFRPRPAGAGNGAAAVINLLHDTKALNAWPVVSSGVSQDATADVSSGIDGSNTADRLIDKDGVAQHWAARSQHVTGLTVGSAYTFSAFVRKDVNATVAASLTIGDSYIHVSPSTGNLAVYSPGVKGRLPDAYLVDDFGQWWRAQLPFVALTTAVDVVLAAGMQNAALASDAGLAVHPQGSVDLWGAQLEAGAIATPFRDQNAGNPQGDQSFSLSTWLYSETTLQGGGGSNGYGRIVFSHTVQDGERTHFGALVREQPGNTFDLVWFEGDLNSSNNLRQRTIAQALPTDAWTHLGMSVDAPAGLVRFYVDGKPTPANADGGEVPVAFGLLPTMSCPMLEPSPGTGILLHGEGDVEGGRSPERIFVATAANNLFGIEEMDANGLGVHDVVRPGDSSAQQADYSPVLDKVVYSSSAGGAYEIWLANGDGSSPIQITKGFGDTARGIFASRPRWAPDGSAVVFESNVYSNEQDDNTWAHVFHLYYIPYDVAESKVAVPFNGATVNQLNYDDLSRIRVSATHLLIQDFRLSISSRQHFNASWLRGSFQDSSGSYRGELLATSADSSWEDRKVMRFVIPAQVRDTVPEELSLFTDLATGVQVELLAARYDQPAGKNASRKLLLSKDWISFDSTPQFKVQLSAISGGYEAVVTHQPTGYGATCWDVDRDQIRSPAEDKNADGVWNVADCYPFEVRNLYVEFNTQLLDPSLNADGDVVVSSAWGTAHDKQVLARTINTAQGGSYVKVELLSDLNNLPIPAGTELARVRFKAQGSVTSSLTPRIRTRHQELYVKRDEFAPDAGVSLPLLSFPRATQAGFDLTYNGQFSRASVLPSGQVVDASYREQVSLGNNRWGTTLHMVRPHQPRWDHPLPGESARLLLEGARSNQLISSADMNGPGWKPATEPGHTNGAADIAPDGSSSAASITGVSTSTAFPAATGVFSFWVRGAASGTASVRAGAAKTFSYTDLWTRQDAPAQANATVSFAGMADTQAWGLQEETGVLFPSSYIPTQGDAATRAADVLVYAEVPADMASGRWTIDVWPEFAAEELVARPAAGADEPTLVSFGGVSDRVHFYRTTAGTFVNVLANGQVLVTAGPLSFQRDQHLTLTFDAEAGSVQVLGSSAGDKTYAGSGWSWPSVNLRIGGIYNGGRELFGRVAEPRTAFVQSNANANLLREPERFVFESDLAEVNEAAFSPSADRLVLSGIQASRPVIVRTAGLLGTADMQVISARPVRTNGLSWSKVERVYPCNWVGGVRNRVSGLYDGALRGGLDELKLYNYVRTPLAFASEAARGDEWLGKAGEGGVPVPHVATCAADRDCADYELCTGNLCKVQTCDPKADYPCARGQCRTLPVPIGLASATPLNVCTVECEVDAQCFQKECLNGPCRFCSQATNSCQECRPAIKDYGMFKLEYIEGCPDRNSFACEQGNCVTECYTFNNGQSQYLCDPALEYCHEGKCTALQWSWPDLAPATLSGLGKANYAREGLRDTIAISQLHDVKIEAFGVEDFLHAPELLIEGQVTTQDAAVFEGSWVELGRISVDNKTLNDASSHPYHIVTYHAADQLRFRLITRPYENLTNASTGLMGKDKDFCLKATWSAAHREACVRRASGSRPNIGYRIGIPKYEARKDCVERFRDSPSGIPNCGDTNSTFQEYLYGGQPAVVISKVEVNGQSALDPAHLVSNSICGYRAPTGNPDDFRTPTDNGLPRQVVFGPAQQEQSNVAYYYNEVVAHGADYAKLPAGLVDFTPRTQKTWALLNCNYADSSTQNIAMLRLNIDPAVYARSLRAFVLPQQGSMNETANGCFVEVDAERTEPCFEMIGDDSSIDILSPSNGTRVNGTLTYDIFRSFGYDP